MRTTLPNSPKDSHGKRLRTTFLRLGLGAILCYPIPGSAQLGNRSLQQLVAKKAIGEWVSFNDPNRPVVKSAADVSFLEIDPLEYRMCLRINHFWAAVPSHDSKPPNENACALNIPPTPQGKGQANKWNAFPWSAAFVSFIMKASGAGNTFKYSGRHATYIVDSVKNRNTPNHPFRGYPINEEMPDIGDLLCAPRGEDIKLTYDEIVQKGDFQSHCDIVVAKHNNSAIEVIGGNVGDTVAKTIVSLTSNGFIDVSDPAFRGWFVVIKNTVSP